LDTSNALRIVKAKLGLQKFGYVSVKDLRKASGLDKKVFQEAFTDLYNGGAESLGFSLYTELPFGSKEFVVTPHGDRVALINFVKKDS